VDTSARPHPFARTLAAAAAARYLPLPRADAGALRAAVQGVARPS
jgi:magnesium chelatase subunit D